MFTDYRAIAAAAAPALRRLTLEGAITFPAKVAPRGPRTDEEKAAASARARRGWQRRHAHLATSAAADLSPSVQAARDWLARPKQPRGAIKAYAVQCGMTLSAIYGAIAREKARLRAST